MNYTVEQKPSGQTIITIPTPKNGGYIFAYTAYILMATTAVYFTTSICLEMWFNGVADVLSNLILTTVSIGMLIIFLDAIQSMVWLLVGKEIFIIEQDQLRIIRKNAWFYKPKTFELMHIGNFEVGESGSTFPLNAKRDTLLRKQTGVIHFDFLSKTVEIGREVSMVDAAKIVDILRQKILKNA